MPALNTARTVLAVCFVVLLVNAGARFALGLVLKPMAEELEWSRSSLSFAVTLFMIVAAVSMPLSGRLVDRFSAKAVLGGGLTLSGLALMALTLVDSPPQFFVVYGVMFAVGSACTAITPIGVLLSQWFPGRLGMANSIAISGMGLGQLLIIAGLASALADIGWRGSYLALGIVTLAVLIPLLAFTRGATPAATSGRDSPSPVPATPTAKVGEVLRTPRLKLLLVIYAICGFQDFMVATHIVAFALDEGVTPIVAGNMLALMGLAGLVGVLATGVWNDRSGPVPPTIACFVLRMALFAAILMSQNSVVIVAAALAYGATFWMTAPLTVVFASQSVGPAQLGTVAGIITMVHHLAGGVGALVAANLFDRLGNYHSAFVLLLVLSVLATVLTARIDR